MAGTSFQYQRFSSGLLSGVKYDLALGSARVRRPSTTISSEGELFEPIPGTGFAPVRITSPSAVVINPLFTRIVDPPLSDRSNAWIRWYPALPSRVCGPCRIGGPTYRPLMRTRRNAKSGRAERLSISAELQL
jgi:hypothetical protein